VTVYDLKIILECLQFSHKEFIDYCILCGCDYCDRIPGIGGIKALKLLKQHGSVQDIVRSGAFKEEDVQAYLDKYRIAQNIFSLNLENLYPSQATPEWPSHLEEELNEADDISKWILANTNYTLNTLSEKLRILKVVV